MGWHLQIDVMMSRCIDELFVMKSNANYKLDLRKLKNDNQNELQIVIWKLLR